MFEELDGLKYGNLCKCIAKNILGSEQDAEECVNDTYLAVWNAIPPARPDSLQGYISRVARNVSLKRYRSNTAIKRNSYYDVSLEEIGECIGNGIQVEEGIMAEELVESVLGGVEEKYLIEAAQYSQGKRNFKPARMVMKVAACLALMVALPVISLSVATAAGVDSAYDMLYSINPSMALKMRPVNISCEDNGIKMEVEAVSIQKDTAKIYISMQDLTGDRIDSTTDLFDSAGIESKYDCSGTCSLESYDEKEKKATFLVYQKTFDHKKIGGSKVKFSVSRFLSHKKSMEEPLSAIHLGQVPADPKTQKGVDIRGESAIASGQEEIVANEFLAENEEQKFSPIEGVTVTAYGFVQDKLHIQVDYGDILKTDNHGDIYLKDEDGNVIHCSKNMSFWHEDGKGSYEEYVFDIGTEDLEGLSVWGYFVVCDSLTEGEWSVTFPMEER